MDFLGYPTWRRECPRGGEFPLSEADPPEAGAEGRPCLTLAGFGNSNDRALERVKNFVQRAEGAFFSID